MKHTHIHIVRHVMSAIDRAFACVLHRAPHHPEYLSSGYRPPRENVRTLYDSLEGSIARNPDVRASSATSAQPLCPDKLFDRKGMPVFNFMQLYLEARCDCLAGALSRGANCDFTGRSGAI